MIPFTLLLFAFTSLTAGDLPPFYQNEAFDDAKCGPYPVQPFLSSPELAPRPNVQKADPDPDHTLYTFFEPRGWKVGRPGPMIVDADWHLIWTSPWWGNTYNHKVQRWKGRDYITFWAGDDGVGGHGEGYMYMLDSSYKTVKRLAAKNGYMSDQHAFTITDRDTALFSVYERRKATVDFTDTLGTEYIWDCILQEIEIDTGEVIFEWRATDHIPFTDSYDPPQNDGLDWFHLNSIELDSAGNYLISSRYTHALYYISGKDGHIFWTLGGKHSSFEDLSDGRATDFCYQHDAQWHANQTRITLFDNHSENLDPDRGISKGMTLAVDLDAMTVDLVAEYPHPGNFSCVSQGSMQVLENGNVFLGWGFCGLMSEFKADGTLVSDVHLGPPEDTTRGNVQTYRARKMPWVGLPDTRPDIATGDGAAYVSWNGATEVKSWELQHASNGLWASEDDWESLDKVDRAGFETEIPFKVESPRRYMRVVAYDTDGKRLGATRAADWRFARTRIARCLHLLDIPSFIGALIFAFLVSYTLFRIVKASVKRMSLPSASSFRRPWPLRRRGPSYSALPQHGFEDNGSFKES